MKEITRPASSSSGHIRPELAASLYKKVNGFHQTDIPWDAWMDFLNSFRMVKVKRGEYLVREGETCKSLYFLLNGAVRHFVVEEDKEVNLHFYFTGDIFSEFESLRSGNTTDRNLVAMVPCMLLEGRRNEYVSILEGNHELSLAAMAFYSAKLEQEQTHSQLLKAKSPAERYQFVLASEPHLLKNVPLSQLASYIGISRKSLSRIRGQL